MWVEVGVCPQGKRFERSPPSLFERHPRHLHRPPACDASCGGRESRQSLFREGRLVCARPRKESCAHPPTQMRGEGGLGPRVVAKERDRAPGKLDVGDGPTGGGSAGEADEERARPSKRLRGCLASLGSSGVVHEGWFNGWFSCLGWFKGWFSLGVVLRVVLSGGVVQRVVLSGGVLLRVLLSWGASKALG
jgi:hypothetical protein